MGTGTNAGDVTAVSGVGDGTVTTGVSEMGTEANAGDVTAVSDVGDETVRWGLGQALVT